MYIQFCKQFEKAMFMSNYYCYIIVRQVIDSIYACKNLSQVFHDVVFLTGVKQPYSSFVMSSLNILIKCKDSDRNSFYSYMCDLVLQSSQQVSSTSLSFYLYSSWNLYDLQKVEVIHQFDWLSFLISFTVILNTLKEVLIQVIISDNNCFYC